MSKPLNFGAIACCAIAGILGGMTIRPLQPIAATPISPITRLGHVDKSFASIMEDATIKETSPLVYTRPLQVPQSGHVAPAPQRTP